MSLLFSHFCPSKPICNEKITAVDHAFDRFVDAVDRALVVAPLLNPLRQSLFEFRST